jgi:hypothetical protein
MRAHPLPSPTRVPRGGIDRIHGPAPALALITAAITLPLAPEVVGIPLDADRVGRVVTVVDGSHDPDAVVLLAGLMAEAAMRPSTGITSLVLATVRPHGGIMATDIDRWFEASALVEARGLTLLEWFVITDEGVWLPRELVGESARW